MKIVDLTHPLKTGMPVYPGDPKVSIQPSSKIQFSGVNVSSLHLGSHSGTHIDAPSHIVQDGRTIDRVELNELSGDALVIRANKNGALRARTQLTPQLLGIDSFKNVPKIVTIETGWDAHFGLETYVDHPFLSAEAATMLWQMGMRILAIDTLSPDETLGKQSDFPVHKIVLGNDGLIVENLRGLNFVSTNTKLGFFPLSLGAVDGAPVRAVAFE